MSTMLLLHGAFCRGWIWGETIAALEAAGHRAATIELPSSGPSAGDLGDLSSDVDAVATVLDSMEGDAVLVGHSGAGMVLTELADHPHVRRGVYVSAFRAQRGQSVGDLLGGQFPDWMAVRGDGAVQVASDADVVREALCHDVDRDRFLTHIYPLYVLTSISSLTAPSTAPDPTHPSSYIICENDRAVPPEAQEAMAGEADQVYRLSSSHSPLLSMPRQLADAIVGA